MTTLSGWHPVDHPPDHPGQLKLTDMRPGQRFIWRYPHLDESKHTIFMEVTEYPTEDGRFEYRYVDTPDLSDHGYLQDAGIIPYGNKLWNTNWLEAVTDG